MKNMEEVSSGEREKQKKFFETSEILNPILESYSEYSSEVEDIHSTATATLAELESQYKLWYSQGRQDKMDEIVKVADEL
jgi:hypothetical protein